MSHHTPPGEFDTPGFFVMRTPLLPFDELMAWTEGLQTASAGDDPARLEAALAEDHAVLGRRLREAFAQPELREALFVASHSLDERLDQDDDKVLRALARYFVRMAGRPTPFSLFAGCSVGTVGASTRLDLDARLAVLHQTRNTFAAGFHADGEFEYQLAARFRKERKDLEALIDPGAIPDASLAEGVEVLRHRSGQLAPIMTGLRARAEAGRCPYR
jgi:hypothetical protein